MSTPIVSYPAFTVDEFVAAAKALHEQRENGACDTDSPAYTKIDGMMMQL